MVIIWSCINL